MSFKPALIPEQFVGKCIINAVAVYSKDRYLILKLSDDRVFKSVIRAYQLPNRTGIGFMPDFINVGGTALIRAKPKVEIRFLLGQIIKRVFIGDTPNSPYGSFITMFFREDEVAVMRIEASPVLPGQKAVNNFAVFRGMPPESTRIVTI